MALSSYSTTLTIGGSLLGEVTNIAIGGSSLTEIDITNLSSTDKAYIMGALEAGTLTVDFFAPADFASFSAGLIPVSGDNTAATFVISFAGSALDATFDGICTNLSISAEQDGAVTASATVKLVNAIAWT
jgi:hypothetical protein